MEVYLYFTLVVSAILVTNISSGSYLTMDVSSNPILSGLTKTLTMSCYIRGVNLQKLDTVALTENSTRPEPTEVSANASLPPWTTTTLTETNTRLDTTAASIALTALPWITSVLTETTSRLKTTGIALESTATTNTIPTQKPQLQATSSPADISHLMALVITKRNSPGEDETVARVTPYDPAAADGSYVGIVQVNGSVFHTPVNNELGYLTLIWSAPLDDPVGTYTCEADGLTHSGHLVTLTGSLEIQARQPNVADLVPLIVDFETRISQLEQENQELKHRLDMLKV